MELIIGDKVVLYDKEDQGIVSSRKWHINDSGYVVWRGMVDGKKKTVRLHRLIANTPDGMVTDHLNHNKTDNRRSNLRVCTQLDNARNRKEPGKGYWFQKQNKNWVVEVYGKHIGCFDTEEEASYVATTIKSGGLYKKPIRKLCKYGHPLDDAYRYGKEVRCKPCTKRIQRKYYERKRLLVSNAEKWRSTMLNKFEGTLEEKEEQLTAHLKRMGSKGGAASNTGGYASEKIGKDGLTGKERAKKLGKIAGHRSKTNHKFLRHEGNYYYYTNLNGEEVRYRVNANGTVDKNPS